MSDADQLRRGSVFTYDLGDGEPLSHGVVAAVSAAADVAPVAADDQEVPVLDPLYGAIDPDALDGMFAARGAGTSRRQGRVTFAYGGHRVTAGSDGRITVWRSADRAEGTGD